MARLRRPLAAFSLVAILGLLAAACGGSTASSGTASASASAPAATASASTSGSTSAAGANRPVRVGMDVDAGTLDPRLMTDTTAYRVTALIYDGLVLLDDKLQPQPDLATSWDAPNPTTYVFHLRQGVKFQDGTPLTADDVVYTYTTITDPALKSPMRALYAPIKSVVAIDPNTVQFNLSKPYAPLLQYLDLGIVPKHIASTDATSLAQHPVGTGPFTFQSWAKNSKIELVANKDYWGGAPTVPGVEIDVIPDNSARAAALEAGNVDLIMSPMSSDDITRLQGESSRITATTMAGLGETFFTMNTKDPILSDVRVRQAVAHLIDQQTIITQIYKGVDKPAVSILLPSWTAYTDTIKQPAYDPAAATQLLQQAGWTKGSSGWAKGGQPLKLVLQTHTEDPNRVQTIEFLQNQFQGFGIQATVKTSDFASFLADLLAGRYQFGMLGGLNWINPDRGLYNSFHTGGTNFSFYSNPQVDQLLDDARSSSDAAQQTKDYQQFATILSQDVPYEVLSYQGYQAFVGNSLQGYVVNPRGNLRSLAQAHLTGS